MSALSRLDRGLAHVQRGAARLMATLSAQASQLTDLLSTAQTHGNRLAALEIRVMRTGTVGSVSIPAGTSDLTLRWPRAWTDSSYGVYPVVLAGPQAQGKVFAQLKVDAGAKSVADVTITVVNLTGAGVQIAVDVLGVRTIQ